MKKFSEINNIELTGKDHLINQMVSVTGLEENLVTKLYESFSFETDGTLDQIKQKFTSFLNTEIDTVDTFFDKVLDLSKDVKNYDDVILSVLATSNLDSSSLFKVVGYLLHSLNPENFNKIAKIVDVDFNLMESVEIEKIIGINDGSNFVDKSKFYLDLKTILSRNNRKWGQNYHLDNVYDTIVNYLDTEIQALSIKNNVNTVNDVFHNELIHNLINGEINPLYRNVDTLRNLVPDMQTLVFDLMCLVTQYIKANIQIMQYISIDTYNDYIKATKDLYAGISSSRSISKVCVLYVEPNTDATSESYGNNYIGDSTGEFLANIDIDFKKYDLYYHPLQLRSLIDMVYIIKSVSVDFNLKLRPVLRNYVTKSFEILAKTEKAIIKSNSIKSK